MPQLAISLTKPDFKSPEFVNRDSLALFLRLGAKFSNSPLLVNSDDKLAKLAWQEKLFADVVGSLMLRAIGWCQMRCRLFGNVNPPSSAKESFCDTVFLAPKR